MTNPADPRDENLGESVQAGHPPASPPGIPEASPPDVRPQPDAPSTTGNTMRVVVGAGGLLLFVLLAGGKLMVAVKKVRESAARLQTNNNLKQCALAVHTYHDNFDRLPNGFGKGGQFKHIETSSWVHLLPYVESNPLYSYLADHKPGVAYTTVMAPYLAPSDSYATGYSGVVNFAVNVRIVGHKTLEENGQPVNVTGSAVEVPNGTMISGLRLQGIADGTTNVIMFSTRYSECGGQRTWFAADAHGNSNHGPPPSPGKGGFMGAGSASTPATKAGPITATFQLEPNERECLPTAGVFGHSFGAGGMSVALCDSAVRNIAPTMSPETFSRALCPSDGQPLDDDWQID